MGFNVFDISKQMSQASVTIPWPYNTVDQPCWNDQAHILPDQHCFRALERHRNRIDQHELHGTNRQRKRCISSSYEITGTICAHTLTIHSPNRIGDTRRGTASQSNMQRERTKKNDRNENKPFHRFGRVKPRNHDLLCFR